MSRAWRLRNARASLLTAAQLERHPCVLAVDHAAAALQAILKRHPGLHMSDPTPSRGADRLTVELRGQCPREVVDVLDAVALARDIERTELVNEVLKEYAARMVHLANVVSRVTRGNPALSDINGARTA